jgi:death on curing protein
MIFPEKLDVLTVHGHCSPKLAELVDSRTKLYSSRLSRQLKSSHYEADVVSCAATYAYHLTQSHAFFDGNKRIGAAVTEAFLENERT